MANLPLAYYVESYTRLPIRPSSVTLQTYCSELLVPYACGEIDSLAHLVSQVWPVCFSELSSLHSYPLVDTTGFIAVSIV